MKHVGSAARSGFRVLVTGFGAFPGAPINPTISILDALQASRADFARRGIDLSCAVMPVVYNKIAGTLQQLVAEHRPEAILHLGLAGRRASVSVETRAVNRAHPTSPDADGMAPEKPMFDGPANLMATFPAGPIVSAIRKIGVPVRRSASAGTYVCNATLYHSLSERLAAQVGFLHVPRPCEEPGRTIADLVRAAEEAVLAMARHAPRWDAAAAPTEPPTALLQAGR